MTPANIALRVIGTRKPPNHDNLKVLIPIEVEMHCVQVVYLSVFFPEGLLALKFVKIQVS